MLIPTPASLAAQLLPEGIPFLRQQVRARVGSTTLDPAVGPGDPGLFGPGSATWQVLGQTTQALAGLRAALLQALSAPVPTAVDSTGTFARDLGGRVARTGAFVEQQNLGSMDEVFRSARRVRAMHRTIKGTAPDGTPFDAGDPHQQAWVSMTLTDSMLVMSERYGEGRLPADRADAFVREQSRHGALLDPRVDLEAIFGDPERRAALQSGELPLPLIDEGELPTTVAELRTLMDAWTPELSVTRRTRLLLDAAVKLHELPVNTRRLARPFVLATLATVPDAWHELLAPDENRLDEHLVAQLVQTPIALARLALGRSAGIDAAHARMRLAA